MAILIVPIPCFGAADSDCRAYPAAARVQDMQRFIRNADGPSLEVVESDVRFSIDCLRTDIFWIEPLNRTLSVKLGDVGRVGERRVSICD